MKELQQLVLAKQFLTEAEEHLLREDDYGNGQAVSLAQDSVELLMRAAARHHSVPLKPKDGFSGIVEALAVAPAKGIPALPQQARLEDLNKSRINFKHYGTAPSAADARRLVGYATIFAEEACDRYFELSWSGLSLADAIRSDEIRQRVKRAEQALHDRDLREAVIEAADAVHDVERQLSSLLPRAQWRGEFDNNRGTVDYLNALRLVSLAALVNVDLVALLRFQQIGVQVVRTAGGRRHVNFSKTTADSEESATFAVAFARDFALAVQAKLRL